MTIQLAKQESKYFALAGGMNLQTPAISLPPGLCVDAQNYEPDIDGGYKRIDGYERYDGHSSASSADYWLISLLKTNIITVGSTLTGQTSGNSFKILSLTSDTSDSYGALMVCGRLTGPLTVFETFSISYPDGGFNGAAASLNSPELKNAAASLSTDADYALLAANDWRLYSLAIPGSGAIRGLQIYNDVLYGFRDNAAGTAGGMYKATAAGWVQIAFPYELQFNTGTAAIAVGNTVTDLSGAVSGVVTAVLLRSGTFVGGDAAGSLIFASITGGNWALGGQIRIAGVQKATAAAASAQITRAPGGKLEFDNYNFTGSTSTLKMYGADGVNPCFEFDGTNYYHIRTGMTADTPSHVIGHKKCLWLSFLGSVQKSALGDPRSWTAVLGALEFATGDPVTGFLSTGGASVGGSALSIFTAGKTFTLYGNTSTDFVLTNTNGDIGYKAYTSQSIGGNAYGLTSRGIQALTTTQNYGDFDYASISHLIQPYMTSKLGTETCSTAIKSKNQYRVFFSDGTGLIVGLTGDKPSGLMPLNYGIPVRCITTATLSTGQEVTYFGSDSGYVYRDNIGTSFDGSVIEAWLRLPFNHQGSPRTRKRWMRAALELSVARYCEVYTSYDLGYGSSLVQPSASMPASQLSGGGAYWDLTTNANWDAQNWDVDVIPTASITLDGTEKTISLSFYSARAQDRSHTIQGITMFFIPRRAER